MIVSVVVPIYNVEKYLVRCVESIIAQTYSNIEIILVNDGSPDNSLSICKYFAKLDKRIKVITQINKGLSGARNTGIKEAQGEYICFIDADDCIDSDMIESCVKVAKQVEADIVLTNVFQYQSGNETYVETKNKLPYEKVLDKNDIIDNLIKPYYGGDLGIIPSACTKLYKVKLLLDNNLIFDETLKRSEDYWFNFFSFQKAKRVFCINRSFYHYYSNSDSMIKSYREGQFEAFLNNRKTLINEHKKFDFPINWKVLNNQFVNNINELILLEINVKGIFKAYKNISNYLHDEDFLKIYENTNFTKKHIRIIRVLLANRLFIIAITVFYLWSFKAK